MTSGELFEITKGIVHHQRLRGRTSRLKPIYSDNAVEDSVDRQAHSGRLGASLTLRVLDLAGRRPLHLRIVVT